MSLIANEHQVISSLLASPVQKMSTALDPLFSSVNMGLTSVASPASSPEPAGTTDLTGTDAYMAPASSTTTGADMQMKYEPYIDIDSVSIHFFHAFTFCTWLTCRSLFLVHRNKILKWRELLI